MQVVPYQRLPSQNGRESQDLVFGDDFGNNLATRPKNTDFGIKPSAQGVEIGRLGYVRIGTVGTVFNRAGQEPVGSCCVLAEKARVRRLEVLVSLQTSISKRK